ncbi:MAG TPA: HEAT repeat domain-containing protein, partial [Gemmata sp.]|nr:HEAT repeat domain-containing protein [Gemmata sp.]
MHVSHFLARAVAGAGLVAVGFAFAAGCSKKEPPPPPTTPEVTEKPELTPEEKTARDRSRWIASLKSTNQKSRQEAVEQLSIWAETDPATVAALLDLLKDRSTAGRGRTNALQINSIREAAARALLESGGKGEAAIKEKGLAVLRDGLADPDAAVREHTVYTIGLLGPLARPLSGKLIELCTDKDGEVRGRAFDALRSVGITDPTSLAKLMTNEDREVANLAAQLAASLEDVPDAAVPPLVEALASEVEGVPTAAAMALATAGPKAAPAAEGLVAAIKKVKEYQGKYDPEVEYFLGPEYAYWRALAAIGEPAVRPLAGLLTHENALVRGYAAQALGEIGKPAKAVADKLRVAFKDDFGFVAVEAACALVRAGEAKDEAIALMKRAILATNSVAMTAID